MEKLETKDMEIELMNEKIKAAYATIKVLQQWVSELEQRETAGASNTEVDQTNTPTSSNSAKCVLLGDTNLRRVLCSDLDENCFIRTIRGANVDLLRCWVTEKLI